MTESSDSPAKRVIRASQYAELESQVELHERVLRTLVAEVEELQNVL